MMDTVSYKPGPVILMGSGETSPNSGTVFEGAARLFPKPVRIAILETPAGFELNSDRVAGRVGEFLQNRLQNYQPIIDIVPARKKGTAFSPDDIEILAPLFSADLIFLGPGSPTYTVRQLQGSLAYEIIQARHRMGAALVLASAATIAFGCKAIPVYEIHKSGMDIHWHDGLNFLKPYGLNLVIVPHWNNTEGGTELDTSRCFMGIKRFDVLRSMLDGSEKILGIDEHTSMWMDLHGKVVKVYGKGQIHLAESDQENSIDFDQQVPFTILGDCKPLPDLRNGIREDIWLQIMAKNREVSFQSGVNLSREMMDLVHQREEARRAGDFSLADRIREEINSCGWRVIDTPDGPITKIIK